MQPVAERGDRIRLVGIGTVIEIADDLFGKRLKGMLRIHLLHIIQNDVAGDDLIVLIFIKIFFQRLLIEGDQMQPEDFFALKHWAICNFLIHETDEVQKFLRAHQKVHSHHHVQMADESAGIAAFRLKLKEPHQFLSRLVFNPDRFLQLFFLKPFSCQLLQRSGKAAQLVGQIRYRLFVRRIGNVQKGEWDASLLFQIPEGIQVPVTGKGGGDGVIRFLDHAALHPSHKSFMIGTQGGRKADVLCIINEIILQMVAAHIAGKHLDGQGAQPEAVNQLAGRKNVAPHIASLPAQGIRHHSHHHLLQLLITFGKIFRGKQAHPPFIRLKAEKNLVPAFLRPLHGLFFYIIDIFVYD